MNSDNYITTKEVAQRLNKSISTIYRYVNEKKLRPVYEDKWQIDSSLLFREEDVEQLIEIQQNKPGYTTGEVAAKLSKHPSTIAMYIKSGKLKTEKREYKGRILNFISEEELEKLLREIREKENGSLNIFNKQNNIFIFQSFHDSKGNKARIVDIDNSGIAELKDNSRISVEDLYQLGYIPVYNIKHQKYVTQKGFVQFRFRRHSNQLDIIESLIVSSGYKNVKIHEKGIDLIVSVKPGLLKEDNTLHLDSDSLNTFLYSGSLVQRHDGILLKTDYQPLMTHVKKDIKDKLKHSSRLEKLSLDDYVERIIEQYFNDLEG